MASDAQLYLNYTKLGGRRVSTQRFAEIGVAARQVRSQKASQVRSKFLPTIIAIQATGASSLRASRGGTQLSRDPDA